MAGIYIHIPFCRQACHYCDFHFSTNLALQAAMVSSICKEIELRNEYLHEKVDTIYFGGGTPSLLTGEQLHEILHSIRTHFEVPETAEISLEANPEDLSIKKLMILKKLGINRLSIGIQTFSDDRLNWMNRIHTAKNSIASYQHARNVGFENISLDLIYAIPDGGHELWERDLAIVTGLDPEHISLYGLTIENRTVFGKRKEKGELLEVVEDVAATQFLQSISVLNKSGFEQYEVSNFSKPNFRSRHNSSYWSGVPYLGVGPGAHSFDGESRQFNVRNNAHYIKSLTNNRSFYEHETLSKVQRMNETILTRFRTIEGLNTESFKKNFKTDLLQARSTEIDKLEVENLLSRDGEFLSLSSEGILVADEIALQLFFDE